MLSRLRILTGTRLALTRPQVLALATTTTIASIYLYLRVVDVNPAILGDEYLYSMNSRKSLLWEPVVAGDFSNYLFNFVYASTNFCGPEFYSCAKALNLLFFVGFALTLFFFAFRFTDFLTSIGVYVAVLLSPLSIYTSMFLPESMYFFLMGLVFVAAESTWASPSLRNWILLGGLVGLASLVKPHAWLTVTAIGVIFIVQLVTTGRASALRQIGFATVGLFTAVITRIILGYLVAGPKAIGLFGQYVGSGTIDTVLAGSASTETGNGTSYIGAGPLAGVQALFSDQVFAHLVTVVTLVPLGMVAFSVAAIRSFHKATASRVDYLTVNTGIWTLVMVVQIAIFTGWVTGGGDDHTTRLLLRYYEFLLPVFGTAVVIYFRTQVLQMLNVWVRWGLAALALIAIGPGFSGFYNNLTIQIADAPSVAGLITNLTAFSTMAVLSALTLLIFATFPNILKFLVLPVIASTMLMTGWNTHYQYETFRGEKDSFDLAGLEATEILAPDDRDKTLILATSRFEATGAAFWLDSAGAKFEIVLPDYPIDVAALDSGAEFVVTIGSVLVEGEFSTLSSNEGFKILQVRD